LSNLLCAMEEGLGKVAGWLNQVAALALVAMMILVNSNVIFRPLGKPIWGTFEIVGFLGTIVISFSLIQTTFSRGHMAVEIITSRLHPYARVALGLANRVICMIMLGLVAWQSAVYGQKVIASGQVSATLKMPIYPFLYGIALAFGISAVIVLVDIVRAPLRLDDK